MAGQYTESYYQAENIRADKFIAKTDAPTNITTAGAVTYTAAQIVGGIILRDCNGGGRTDVLPSATNLLAALPGLNIGDTIKCRIINTSTGATSITISADSSGGFDAAQTATSKTIVQDASKEVYIRITGISTPAYVVYM